MNTPITLFYGTHPSTFDVNALIKNNLKRSSHHEQIKLETRLSSYQPKVQFAFELSKYSMPVCFFAHPDEIQLDLASLTSSNWKHINLMYKVEKSKLEKRMQLKTH